MLIPEFREIGEWGYDGRDKLRRVQKLLEKCRQHNWDSAFIGFALLDQMDL